MSLQLDGRDGSSRSMLAIEGLTKSFGVHRVLRDVVLSVREGGVHAISGPNGAGKTTLVNVITGVQYRHDVNRTVDQYHSICGRQCDLDLSVHRLASLYVAYVPIFVGILLTMVSVYAQRGVIRLLLWAPRRRRKRRSRARDFQRNPWKKRSCPMHETSSFAESNPVVSGSFDREIVLSVRRWTDTLFSFTTTRPPGFDFTNGQFALISPDRNMFAPLQALGIASPDHDDVLEFLCGSEQPQAAGLQQLKPGDKLMVGRRARGKLVLNSLKQGTCLYLLGSGTGIASFSFDREGP